MHFDGTIAQKKQGSCFFQSFSFDVDTFAKDNKSVTKIQVMKTGIYKGLFDLISFTSKDFENMIQNFDNKVLGIDVQYNYSHEMRGKAAGWIKKLYTENDGNELWAEVEWTPKALQAIKDKEYRYSSAEIDFNYEHNETMQKFGVTLTGAALTNIPFITGMEPNSKLSKEEINMDIQTLQKNNDTLIKRVADLEAENKELKAFDAAGMTSKIATLSKENSELKETVMKQEKEKALGEKNKEFDKMLLSKTVVEAQREHFLSGNVVEFAKAAQPIFDTPQGSGVPAGKTHLSGSKDVQDILCEKTDALIKEQKAEGVFEDYASSFRIILSQNPELEKQYNEMI